MTKTLKILLAILALVIIGVCIYYPKLNKTEVQVNNPTVSGESVVVNVDKNTNTTGIANPASVNCTKVGGNLVIEKRGDGGEYGLCYFEENRACEEWALLRGDCPVGGRKTTGYDAIDQKYCAWIGGQTFAVENSVCTFNDGSICTTVDLYNGKCAKSDNPPIACTMDAKKCPDGTYVGRTGPKCEFVCPR